MSNVSRSVYQKVCEENKKMRNDLYILTFGSLEDNHKWWDTHSKWYEIFEKEKKFRKMLKEAAIEYVKEHPELNIQLPSQAKTDQNESNSP